MRPAPAPRFLGFGGSGTGGKTLAMMTFEAWRRPDLKILCIGAHSDDIEIGCGGTLLRILREASGVTVDWAVFSGNAERIAEAQASAKSFLAGAAAHKLHQFAFEESFMPWNGAAIKREFEGLKALAPHIVFTHCRHDLHQDHRLLSELTWNAFRNHVILEYEIPKYEGDLVTPNVYVPLDEETCRKKLELLERHFGSQRSKQWFDEELFRSMLRLRGIECVSPTRYAEGFHGRKLVL